MYNFMNESNECGCKECVIDIDCLGDCQEELCQGCYERLEERRDREFFEKVSLGYI
jgi:hypothetical protein